MRRRLTQPSAGQLAIPTRLLGRYSAAMTVPDPLDDLGTKNCPRCPTPMDVAGDVTEYSTDARPLVLGSAWWVCPTCGTAAIA